MAACPGWRTLWDHITEPKAVLGSRLPSQSKKKLPMELNPGEGGTLSGYLQKQQEKMQRRSPSRKWKKQPGDKRDPRGTSKANKSTGLVAERGRKRGVVDSWLCFQCLGHRGLKLSLPTLQPSLPREKAEKHLVSPAQMCSDF